MQVSIGEKLPCSEMMFCAILSNVLENAMHAVQELPQDKRYIELSLSEKVGHLLLMEKNTVRSVPTFADGVPVTERSGHGLVRIRKTRPTHPEHVPNAGWEPKASYIM